MDADQARLGEPVKLRQDCLPTKQDIYNHYLYLKKMKRETGEWRHNTPVIVTVKLLLCDAKKQWNKTKISHILEGRRGEKVITNIIN